MQEVDMDKLRDHQEQEHQIATNRKVSFMMCTYNQNFQIVVQKSFV